jgi:hypothetical protein
MEGKEKPHTDKHKEITNDWNYNASCMLTSLSAWNLKNFKHLIFVLQCVHISTVMKRHPYLYTAESGCPQHPYTNGYDAPNW